MHSKSQPESEKPPASKATLRAFERPGYEYSRGVRYWIELADAEKLGFSTPDENQQLEILVCHLAGAALRRALHTGEKTNQAVTSRVIERLLPQAKKISTKLDISEQELFSKCAEVIDGADPAQREAGLYERHRTKAKEQLGNAIASPQLGPRERHKVASGPRPQLPDVTYDKDGRVVSSLAIEFP